MIQIESRLALAAASLAVQLTLLAESLSSLYAGERIIPAGHLVMVCCAAIIGICLTMLVSAVLLSHWADRHAPAAAVKFRAQRLGAYQLAATLLMVGNLIYAVVLAVISLPQNAFSWAA